MGDRFEKDTYKATVTFRNTDSGKEYIDIELEMLCPACPEDKEQAVLHIENVHSGIIWASCPECHYKAEISVYEG